MSGHHVEGESIFYGHGRIPQSGPAAWFTWVLVGFPFDANEFLNKHYLIPSPLQVSWILLLGRPRYLSVQSRFRVGLLLLTLLP